MKLANKQTVAMGKPIKTPFLIPVKHNSTPACINSPFTVNGEIYRVTCVSFGTPHGAVIVDDVDSIDAESLGYSLGTHPLFPQGASIVFIQLSDKEQVKARVWQRGEGEIPFSREGAAVALTSLIMTQKVLTDYVHVSMKGGTVKVRLNRSEDIVYMTGEPELISA